MPRRIVPKKIVKKVAKKTFKYAYKSTKNDIKNATTAIKSGLNSNYKQSSGTTDTGAQSVDLVKNTGKKTVKTVKKTVKTTQKTVKTVKNAPKNIKRTAQATAKAAKATAKAVKTVVQVTVKVVAKLIAFLSDPVVLAVVLAVIIIALIVIAFISVLQGAAAGEATTRQAYSQAAGLGDVPKEFQQGLQVLNKCKDDMKNEYAKWIIDHLHYDDNNKRESDLVYLERHDKDNNPPKVFETDFATGDLKGGRKKDLIDALEWDCGIDDTEILSIAYVLEQKSKNEITPEAEYKIHTVKYTEELINKVLCKIVEWKDSHVDNNQKCPSEDCVAEKVYKHNGDFDTAQDHKRRFENGKKELDYIQDILNDYRDNYKGKQNQADAGRWNWVRGEIDKWNSNYGHNDYGGDYSIWWGANYDISGFKSEVQNMINWINNDLLPNTPENFEYTEHRCDYKHKLYSEVLEFYNKEQVMNMLSFNDTDKYWQHLTEQYLKTFSAPTNP